MPVVKTKIIRTMRDIWDEERKAIKKQKESAVFSKQRAFGKQAEEGLAKTRRYFLEHLELKRVVMNFFPDYQRYLGEAGFTKI